MKLQTLTLILLVTTSSIAVVAPVSAQTDNATTAANATTTTTPVAPDGAPEQVDLVLDDTVAITDWSYRDGQFVIDFYASDYTTVTVAASPEARGQQGTIAFRTVVVDQGTITTVRVQSPSAVSMWTENSRKQGRAYYLRKTSGFLVSGPYSGDDVRNAAIGGALGIIIAVLYEAVAAKIGAAERGERVA